MGKEKESGIDHIYVVHALKGYEVHEERLKNLFAKNGFDFEFVTGGDPSVMTAAQKEKYFSSDIDQKLSVGVLSCTLNHILCYEQMLKNKDEYALILENDPFFLGDFVTKIKCVINEAKGLEKGFMISLENTTLEFPPAKKIRKNKLLYPEDHGRCAGAYILDYAGASAILCDLETNKCGQVIDWWHNNMIDRGVIKMYWAHPPFVEQGSHNGKMNSTISSKAKGLIRQVKWVTQKSYKTYLLRHFK